MVLTIIWGYSHTTHIILRQKVVTIANITQSCLNMESSSFKGSLRCPLKVLSIIVKMYYMNGWNFSTSKSVDVIWSKYDLGNNILAMILWQLFEIMVVKIWCEAWQFEFDTLKLMIETKPWSYVEKWVVYKSRLWQFIFCKRLFNWSRGRKGCWCWGHPYHVCAIVDKSHMRRSMDMTNS
jgi:hypothetical protein